MLCFCRIVLCLLPLMIRFSLSSPELPKDRFIDNKFVPCGLGVAVRAASLGCCCQQIGTAVLWARLIYGQVTMLPK